jgi:nicotinate-nucleotide adenylyltransferase
VRALGVLGGTFDPVHRGHLALAEGARAALSLERVLLVPCAVPPHKPTAHVLAAYHRLEMLYLAAEGWPGLAVAADEIYRGGVSYTIDTLHALRASGLRPVFIAGSDALAEIATWREPEALLREFDFVAVGRPKDLGSERVAAGPPPNLPIGPGGRIVTVPLEVPPISSSLVRARAAAGEPLSDLVPPRVARYIQRHHLYR